MHTPRARLLGLDLKAMPMDTVSDTLMIRHTSDAELAQAEDMEVVMALRMHEVSVLCRPSSERGGWMELGGVLAPRGSGVRDPPV